MLELFHYHHWTPLLDETERFYAEQGFTVTRPEEQTLDVRKGVVHLTFSHGEATQFDHFGLLVTADEQAGILTRAAALGWEVQESAQGPRIQTPWGFHIELQLTEAMPDADTTRLDNLILRLAGGPGPEGLAELLDLEQLPSPEGESLLADDWCLYTIPVWSGHTHLGRATFTNTDKLESPDPCAVNLSVL